MSAEHAHEVDLRDVVDMVIAYARRHHPEALSSDLLIDVRTRDGYRVFSTSVHQLRLTAGSPPGMGPPTAGTLAQAPEPTTTLTDTQEAIEAVLRLTERPIKLVTIAAKAGKVFNSHFRAAVRTLKKAGRVVATPENRYWLVSRGKPPG